MSKILGKNVSLSILTAESPDVLQVIGCSRNCSLTTAVVTAPKSTAGSGLWQEIQGLSNNWTISVDGFATVNENLDIESLRNLQFLLEPVVISFQEVTSGGTTYYAGSALILSVQTTGNYADAETYSVQLQGTGELQIA